MARRRTRLCLNPSNKPEVNKRRRIKRVEDEEGQARFERGVAQARRLIHGHLAKPEDDEPRQDGDDDVLDHFIPRMDEEPEQENDEAGWVDMDAEFDPDGGIRRFVQQHRGYRYAHQRDKLRAQWKGIEDRLAAAYLECQVTTLNWTSKASYLNKHSSDCQCRLVSEPVRFCQCLPEPVQLVYQGYLPASPKQPRTAFSIILLQLYYQIWLSSVTAVSSFIEGLNTFHDGRSRKPMLSRGTRG
ncbi:hypothetical protein DFH28DRAFT_836418, partial [Melampsora americana]